MLDNLHELGSLDQRIVGARIQPRRAAPHDLYLERTGVEILLVQVGDLELAARRGFKLPGHTDDPLVIEVKSGHGVV